MDALDEEGGNDFRVNGDEFCGSFLFFNFFFSISSMFFFQNFHYSFMFLFSFKTKIINAHHRRSRPRNLSTILYQITRVSIYITGCIHRRSVWTISSVQNHHRHMRLSSQREKNDSACKSSLTYQKSQASERVSKSKAPRQYSNEKKKKRWKEKDDDRFLALIQFKTA